ncbi:MAG: hypothetical protein KatS3mg076_0080 [Candidatus Binatia bacterium]|nr:MAG: hypothetical protein KatS3mg076_0080 [Candidatus Binatia bacterium]
MRRCFDRVDRPGERRRKYLASRTPSRLQDPAAAEGRGVSGYRLPEGFVGQGIEALRFRIHELPPWSTFRIESRSSYCPLTWWFRRRLRPESCSWHSRGARARTQWKLERPRRSPFAPGFQARQRRHRLSLGARGQAAFFTTLRKSVQETVAIQGQGFFGESSSRGEKLESSLLGHKAVEDAAVPACLPRSARPAPRGRCRRRHPAERGENRRRRGERALLEMQQRPPAAEEMRHWRALEEEHLRWGGYPALEKLDEANRRVWLRDFRRTYLERDLADLGRVADLDQFVLAQNLLAAGTAQLRSYSEVARELGVAGTRSNRWDRASGQCPAGDFSALRREAGQTDPAPFLFACARGRRGLLGELGFSLAYRRNHGLPFCESMSRHPGPGRLRGRPGREFAGSSGRSSGARFSATAASSPAAPPTEAGHFICQKARSFSCVSDTTRKADTSFALRSGRFTYS